MIRSFRNQRTSALFEGIFVKGVPDDIRRRTEKKLQILDDAQKLEDLRVPFSNHLEILLRERLGQHSIRINDQWRLAFRWTTEGPEDVEFTDYH